jgi:hypothetical protein
MVDITTIPQIHSNSTAFHCMNHASIDMEQPLNIQACVKPVQTRADLAAEPRPPEFTLARAMQSMPQNARQQLQLDMALDKSRSREVSTHGASSDPAASSCLPLLLPLLLLVLLQDACWS